MNSRILAISINEGLLLLADPFPIILLILMPLVLLAFLSNAVLGGPAQSVPGLAALFGYFGLNTVGYAFYRDHGWGTWERIRMSPVRPYQLVLGKAIPLVLLFLIQQGFMLLIGWTVFGMPWRGSMAAGAAMVVAIVAVEVALGLFLTVTCTTVNQLNVMGNLAALLLAGLGGALAPVHRLPAWTRHLAPASPVYWSLKGLRLVITEPSGFAAIRTALIVLGAIAFGFGLLAIRRFRYDEVKTFYA